MADLAPLRAVRQQMIRSGVVDRDMTDDEIEERAAYLLQGLHSIGDAFRPALNDPNLSTGDVLRRLADVADAAERNT